MKKILSLGVSLLILAGCTTLRPMEETRFSGFEGEFLYVNLDGETYCYRREKSGCDGLTPEKVIDAFEIQTPVEGIVWEVWSVREYPNRTTVVVISGTNSAWTYTYWEE